MENISCIFLHNEIVPLLFFYQNIISIMSSLFGCWWFLMIYRKQNIRVDLQINIQNPQFLRMKTFFNVNQHIRCAIRRNPLIICILIVTHIIIFMSKHKRNIMLLNFPLKHQLLSNWLIDWSIDWLITNGLNKLLIDEKIMNGWWVNQLIKWNTDWFSNVHVQNTWKIDRLIEWSLIDSLNENSKRSLT